MTTTENAIIAIKNLGITLPSNHSLLMELYVKFGPLQCQNSIKWSQCSHFIWVCNSDCDTSFLHNSVRIRKHQSHITQIYDLNGNMCTDPENIQHPFMNYYSNLWSDSSTNSLHNICTTLPDDLPTLSQLDGEMLTGEVSKEEVYCTVIDLPTGKSSDPDGFNVEFYQFVCPKIGDHLFSAIQTFFLNSSLPSSWGRTFIALIPKKENPTLV